MTIWRHRGWAAFRSKSWWLRTGVYLAALGALGIPVYDRSVRLGIAHTVLTVIFVLGKAAVYSSDRTMKIVQGMYLERKILLYRLIKDLQRHRAMSPGEVSRFQQETLGLIASYVRSHRADFSATQIYVNLLVEDGDDLVVIARDSEHRKPGARYQRRLMAATTVFETGDHLVVGNVHREYGDVEKPYRSILLLPIRGPEAVLAVLSIDSAKPHHFDLEGRSLERYLAPYVALLEWSLVACHSSRIERSATNGGSEDLGGV
ncbi:MAG: GAF domain-containing protein [Polyangiaceae bacterium]|nr:GAF domain-containing protein [Polyangiaceae bacterium]